MRWFPGAIALALAILGCGTWTPPQAATLTPVSPVQAQADAPVTATLPVPVESPVAPTVTPPAPVEETQASSPLDTSSTSFDWNAPAPSGEPAGCLAGSTQAALSSVDQMLGYADALLGLARPLSARRLDETWNVFAHATLALGDGPVLALDVSDVKNEYLLQRMLDSLHVAGFVAWLRAGPVQDLHILAIALQDPAILQSDWGGYLQAYWQGRDALPPGDPFVIAALKLPPCAWMTAAGLAPDGAGWWRSSDVELPDLASAGTVFLADTTEQANRVARQLDWLGWDGIESATNMCGPLTWAILQRSGALPVDVGSWSRGPESFWLANPRTNGRPWSLFPEDRYTLVHVSQPLGEFDFSTFPLYPGDVLYTYSREDGFDHMLVVTEVDSAGRRYTVTNLVQVYPFSQTTIVRAILYDPNDPTVGLFKNEWRRDRRNGRTGHDGFDVFRWAWLDKDLKQQPVAYIVQPGDSFGRLALEWRTPPLWIAQYNQLQVTDALSPGQQIVIPPNPHP